MNPPDEPAPELSPAARAALRDISAAVYACVRRKHEKRAQEEERRRAAEDNDTTTERSTV